jgi:hydroxymethylpyrimidine/phosphomethylpyrimidine kinase
VGRPALLIVAGTDPTSGAGTVADAVLAARLGVFPCVVETAIVEQDSRGVHAVHLLDPPLVARNVRRAVEERRPAVAKLGMLGCPETVVGLASALEDIEQVVIDPVLRSTGGVALGRVDSAFVDALFSLLERLGGRALVTPNALELGALLELERPRTPAATGKLAATLAARTGARVLAKGGHLERGRGTDVLVAAGGPRRFAPLSWPEDDVRGTGCFLATAVASLLARGHELPDAVARGRRLLAAAARQAERPAATGRRVLRRLP